MDSSSSSTKTKTKLSVRNQTRFKKSSFASNRTTNLSMREKTMLNKAYELSTLCDVQVCVLHYGRDGELIKTWPKDQSKVRDMAERFSSPSHNEKSKKSTNLSQFLNKKINDEKKRSLEKNDNKFSQKVLAMEYSLESRLLLFRDKLRLLRTEPDQNLAVCGSSRTEQNHNFTESSGFFSEDLSSSLINDPLIMNSSTALMIDEQGLAASSGFFTTHLSPSLIDDNPHQQWTDSLTNHLSGGVSSTEQDTMSRAVNYSSGFATDSLNHHQSKFSVFLYNHDNGSFSQLVDSVSSFDTAPPYNNNLNTALLGAQGFGLRSCSNNMVIPPLMQTQNPLLHHDLLF